MLFVRRLSGIGHKPTLDAQYHLSDAWQKGGHSSRYLSNDKGKRLLNGEWAGLASSLRLRAWARQRCGAVQHCDSNAAPNILAAGHGRLAGRTPLLTAQAPAKAGARMSNMRFTRKAGRFRLQVVREKKRTLILAAFHDAVLL